MKKRLLLGASYSIIEPLGLLHLAGLARDMEWDRKLYNTANKQEVCLIRYCQLLHDTTYMMKFYMLHNDLTNE